MKFSVNWLGEFVELPRTIESLAELLTLSGIEIEAIEKRGADYDDVVVAQITESKPHPNADRLTVCSVDDGGGTKRQIVCGAKNYKVGDKVPLALPGAELSGGVKIGASKLRGVDSEGMLCSAKELGIAEDAAGLLILSQEAKIGARIRDLFPPDIILDVQITPNRGDLLSHFGLAREIAALTGKTVASVRGGRCETETNSTSEGINIAAARECPFYSARRIENVRVGPSPDWLRAKVESVGIRSINNVVDISNFVMLELGQPTHAFDADKVGGHINVRSARAGEKFLALDGKTYALTPENIVIADEEHAVGIAGVMGGEKSGVTESTKNVLLESAYFRPASIRSTARNLNLPSDASYRFERGVDPEMILPASARATKLICEITGATAAASISVAGELPPNPPDVSLRYEALDRLLGLHIEPVVADAILTRFGLEQSDSQGRVKTCTTWKIPSYRRDLQREVDLIEEVVRAHGIEKIPSAHRSRFTPLSEADRTFDLETDLRHELIALGLTEVRTSLLIARSELAQAVGAMELCNPLSEDQVALRTSLIAGLLGVIARNTRAGAERIALFEIGNTFAPANGEQRRKLAITLCGQVASAKHWRGAKKRPLDFFDLKGALNSLGAFEFRRSKHAGFVLAAEIFHNKDRIGYAGQLSGTISPTAAVFAAEIDLASIAKAKKDAKRFKEIDRYPEMTRDIAMFVGPKVTHADVLQTIGSANELLLAKVELFDLFMENGATETAEPRKSLAYSLTYRDKNRTLTSEEVGAAHARIRERLRSQIGAELRE
ncbi:MAG: phenylalanine--tRNA ligase subunit beta [Verrucomicrobia bacterium]|nr:MAG: phenylalanine--tRNA ligase subunit beta [Verrucomicrobiota bacterium]